MKIFADGALTRRSRLLLTACLALGLAACNGAGGGGSSAAAEAPARAGGLQAGTGRFPLAGWGGPTVPVWTYIPSLQRAAQLPIVIVMHGTGRDADRYLAEWVPHARERDFIVLVPEFSKKSFAGAEAYNLGNVFGSSGRQLQDEALWSFSAIEPLFSEVVERLGGSQTRYTLYGHSAGSQFVHRFLYYKPGARVKRYIPANAGWYTMPDFAEAYPYGLLGAGIDEEALKLALQKDVALLLGDGDTDINHSSLRRTPPAMRQGAHRFARGQIFFERARQKAVELEVPFGWRLGVVRGASHSNGQMAAAAAKLVY